ncbi:DUF6344 domain-containing protein [Streptomyces sp. NPDC056682]|uniref:DUF6344 domain-containing protein n=1 Tax=Streptomyces sp. NPDC056682 TaxID=3345909 RepID=UPI0036B9FE22
MATSKLTTWWTALISMFVALFAALGFAGQASAAAPAASVPQHDVTYNRSELPASVAPAVHWALPAASALPPTMKQRIRAEAHGASPSSRQRTDVRDAADDPNTPSEGADENNAPTEADEPETAPATDPGAEAPNSADGPGAEAPNPADGPGRDAPNPARPSDGSRPEAPNPAAPADGPGPEAMTS